MSASTESRACFAELPPEIVQYIILFLDTPDILQLSRTSHALRRLSVDPILQRYRLKDASRTLSRQLTHRPERSAISPPQAWIYLSKTNVLSKSISKSLIKIRLGHSLGKRPAVEVLVEKAILPPACTNRALSPIILRQQDRITRSQLKDRLGRKLERRPSVRNLVELNIIPPECVRIDSVDQKKWITISPRFVEVRRRVIRESLKDGLRAWVQRRGWSEQQRREGQWEDGSGITATSGDVVRNVKTLVRKMTVRNAGGRVEHHDRDFSAVANPDKVAMEKKKAQMRWGREVEVQRRRAEKMRNVLGTNPAGDEISSEPARAHVLGLKKFWEGIIKAAAV